MLGAESQWEELRELWAASQRAWTQEREALYAHIHQLEDQLLDEQVERGQGALPETWAAEACIEILDPDGWAQPVPGWPIARAWDEPICLAEFNQRATLSTCRPR